MAEKGHEVFIYSFDEKFSLKFNHVNVIVKAFPKILKKFPWSGVLWASLDCAREKYHVVHYQSQKTYFLSAIVKFFCAETKIVSSFDLVCDFKCSPKIDFDDKKEKNILSRWNLRKKRYMLLADEFKKESGAHFLIEAFKQLEDTAKTPNNFKLVILQTGESDEDYEKYLKTISQGRDNIVILEKQSEKIIWQLFSYAHLYVDTSYGKSSFNQQLTKAMLCAVTPLVSDNSENLEKIGSEGYYFEAKSVISLRDKLAYLLSRSEEVTKTGQSAREKVEKEFGWEEILRKAVKFK